MSESVTVTVTLHQLTWAHVSESMHCQGYWPLCLYFPWHSLQCNSHYAGKVIHIYDQDYMFYIIDCNVLCIFVWGIVSHCYMYQWMIYVTKPAACLQLLGCFSCVMDITIVVKHDIDLQLWTKSDKLWATLQILQWGMLWSSNVDHVEMSTHLIIIISEINHNYE